MLRWLSLEGFFVKSTCRHKACLVSPLGEPANFFRQGNLPTYMFEAIQFMTTHKVAGPFHRPDLSKLILRVTCGGLLILHGSYSAIHGISHVKEMVSRVGLPEFVAYGNLIGEVIAPLFMIAGYKTRMAAMVVAFNMLMSILIAHRDIAFSRNDFGGWMIELNIFYLMTAMAVFFAGAGRYSLSTGKGKWD